MQVVDGNDNARLMAGVVFERSGQLMRKPIVASTACCQPA